MCDWTSGPGLRASQFLTPRAQPRSSRRRRWRNDELGQDGSTQQDLDRCRRTLPLRGVLATGVDTIIENAEVAKATFYKHFGSKDDLIESWLRSPEARWFERVRSETERRTSSPVKRLVTY